MFWIVTGVVVVVLVALAWFSSGFVNKPNTINLDRGNAADQGRAKGVSATNNISNNGGPASR